MSDISYCEVSTSEYDIHGKGINGVINETGAVLFLQSARISGRIAFLSHILMRNLEKNLEFLAELLYNIFYLMVS
jgi:hypothetical protein